MYSGATDPTNTFKTTFNNGIHYRSTGAGFVSINSQGSLNYPFWRYQTIQMYDKLEGLPLSSALFELLI